MLFRSGIDYEIYDPLVDKNLYTNYSIGDLKGKKENKRAFQTQYGLEERDVMMVGVVSRITDQKGFDLLKQTVEHRWVMDKIMDMDIQFVV